MWKLLSIAAIATSVISAPALAQKSASHTQAYQHHYTGGSGIVPSSNAYGPNY